MLTNKALARPLFNSYLMVDWSAYSTPKKGEDSIWVGLTEAGKLVELENPRTRAEACAERQILGASASWPGHTVGCATLGSCPISCSSAH